jgi:hypothetical protein
VRKFEILASKIKENSRKLPNFPMVSLWQTESRNNRSYVLMMGFGFAVYGSGFQVWGVRFRVIECLRSLMFDFYGGLVFMV